MTAKAYPIAWGDYEECYSFGDPTDIPYSATTSHAALIDYLYAAQMASGEVTLQDAGDSITVLVYGAASWHVVLDMSA